MFTAILGVVGFAFAVWVISMCELIGPKATFKGLGALFLFGVFCVVFVGFWYLRLTGRLDSR